VDAADTDSRHAGNFVSAPNKCVRPRTTAEPTTTTAAPTVTVIDTVTTKDGQYTAQVLSRGGVCDSDRYLVDLQVADFGECAALVSELAECASVFSFYESSGDCYCQRINMTNENCMSRVHLDFGVYKLATIPDPLHDYSTVNTRAQCVGDRMLLEQQVTELAECAELARANPECSAYFSYSSSALTCTCQRVGSSNENCGTTAPSAHGVFKLL